MIPKFSTQKDDFRPVRISYDLYRTFTKKQHIMHIQHVYGVSDYEADLIFQIEELAESSMEQLCSYEGRKLLLQLEKSLEDRKATVEESACLWDTHAAYPWIEDESVWACCRAIFEDELEKEGTI